jgi:hypothetical protein
MRRTEHGASGWPSYPTSGQRIHSLDVIQFKPFLVRTAPTACHLLLLRHQWRVEAVCGLSWLLSRAAVSPDVPIPRQAEITAALLTARRKRDLVSVAKTHHIPSVSFLRWMSFICVFLLKHSHSAQECRVFFKIVSFTFHIKIEESLRLTPL